MPPALPKPWRAWSAPSANVQRLLASGATSWYRNHGRECFDLATARLPAHRRARRRRARRHFPRSPTAWSAQNPGASLVDLGDGVACLELHSKKNAIGEDIVRMVTETLRPDGECRAQLRSLRHRRRCRPVLRRRQPDAAAAGRAGRRVGRGRPHGARLPAHDRGHQVLPAARGGGALRLLPRRRRRDRACGGAPPGACGAVHGPGGNRRRPAARRRRLQGDDAPFHQRPAPAPPFRDRRHGQGLHLGRRGAPSRLPRARATASP